MTTLFLCWLSAFIVMVLSESGSILHELVYPVAMFFSGGMFFKR